MTRVASYKQDGKYYTLEIAVPTVVYDNCDMEQSGIGFIIDRDNNTSNENYYYTGEIIAENLIRYTYLCTEDGTHYIHVGGMLTALDDELATTATITFNKLQLTSPNNIANVTIPYTYRYCFNGQERETSLNPSITSAEYWFYDGRLGRRWNVDPVVKLHESPYATFANNPILFIDPNGDDVDIKGHKIKKEVRKELKRSEKFREYYKRLEESDTKYVFRKYKQKFDKYQADKDNTAFEGCKWAYDLDSKYNIKQRDEHDDNAPNKGETNIWVNPKVEIQEIYYFEDIVIAYNIDIESMVEFIVNENLDPIHIDKVFLWEAYGNLPNLENVTYDFKFNPESGSETTNFSLNVINYNKNTSWQAGDLTGPISQIGNYGNPGIVTINVFCIAIGVPQIVKKLPNGDLIDYKLLDGQIPQKIYKRNEFIDNIFPAYTIYPKL